MSQSLGIAKTTPLMDPPFEMTTTSLSIKNVESPNLHLYVGPKPISFEALFDLSFWFNTIHLIRNLGLVGGPFSIITSLVIYHPIIM
jgi:hypothetical protein